MARLSGTVVIRWQEIGNVGWFRAAAARVHSSNPRPSPTSAWACCVYGGSIQRESGYLRLKLACPCPVLTKPFGQSKSKKKGGADITQRQREAREVGPFVITLPYQSVEQPLLGEA